ncbi:MAG TPA: GNAT family N-acetyltransferase [Pyrinomonadaceae bacterium]|jgi:GNAT superfamily N-acetyltransferase|nr:GNAT family N-acetyltransferase [Pyrinomonadaceae bacterium]
MSFTLRKAGIGDREEIAGLIAASVKGLSAGDYNERQIELSVRSVFGVDTELITDGTYFVAVADGSDGADGSNDGEIVGCGGWSKRKTLYGASHYDESRDSVELDPATEPARIRAFFIHPNWARKGIGTAILDACEDEARAHGFTSAEMMATLPGVKLYAVRGYAGDEKVGVPVGDGVEIECIRMKKDLA